MFEWTKQSKKKKIDEINWSLYMYYLFFFLFLMSSCQYLPQLGKEIESIETDKVIIIEISRDIFQKESGLDIAIKVENKKDMSN